MVITARTEVNHTTRSPPPTGCVGCARPVHAVAPSPRTGRDQGQVQAMDGGKIRLEPGLFDHLPVVGRALHRTNAPNHSCYPDIRPRCPTGRYRTFRRERLLPHLRRRQSSSRRSSTTPQHRREHTSVTTLSWSVHCTRTHSAWRPRSLKSGFPRRSSIDIPDLREQISAYTPTPLRRQTGT